MRKVLTVSFNQSNWPVAHEIYKFHWAPQQISDICSQNTPLTFQQVVSKLGAAALCASTGKRSADVGPYSLHLQAPGKIPY